MAAGLYARSFAFLHFARPMRARPGQQITTSIDADITRDITLSRHTVSLESSSLILFHASKRISSLDTTIILHRLSYAQAYYLPHNIPRR